MSLVQAQLLSYILIGFLFGIGFILANVLLAMVAKVLQYLLLKYDIRRMATTPKKKDKPKPPEGLNFGCKIK